ncbi:hypothetical protein [Micromonospora sp. BL1]|uniref:hypothetical protein n=1 Tax=Micromonospora sp. BL1 TaxID=2478709 RepID=UPI0011C3EB79|nr:hypothetical protein [Micromonospora sp. BL1]
MNERTTSRKRTWTCWAGDLSDLRALGRVILDIVDQRRKELVEEKSKALAELRQSYDQETLNLIEEWENPPKEKDEPTDINEIIRQAKASIVNRDAMSRFIDYKVKAGQLEGLRNLDVTDIVELTVVDRYEEVFGKIDPVLDEMDRRSTRSVRFAADGTTPPDRIMRSVSEFVTDGVHVRLGTPKTSLAGGDDPARVIVTSPSAGWARASFARICDEVEKGVPKWAFMRRPPFRSILNAAYFFCSGNSHPNCSRRRTGAISSSIYHHRICRPILLDPWPDCQNYRLDASPI